MAVTSTATKTCAVLFYGLACACTMPTSADEGSIYGEEAQTHGRRDPSKKSFSNLKLLFFAGSGQSNGEVKLESMLGKASVASIDDRAIRMGLDAASLSETDVTAYEFYGTWNVKNNVTVKPYMERNGYTKVKLYIDKDGDGKPDYISPGRAYNVSPGTYPIRLRLEVTQPKRPTVPDLLFPK